MVSNATIYGRGSKAFESRSFGSDRKVFRRQKYNTTAKWRACLKTYVRFYKCHKFVYLLISFTNIRQLYVWRSVIVQIYYYYNAACAYNSNSTHQYQNVFIFILKITNFKNVLFLNFNENVFRINWGGWW